MTGPPASPIRDLPTLLAALAPQLDPATYVFATLPDGLAPAAALATIREAEGLSAILPAEGRAGPPMRRITLAVPSDLEAVGLTAAVAAALTAENIPCNVVAGHHHDHLFVPAARAGEALAVLEALQGHARGQTPRSHDPG